MLNHEMDGKQQQNATLGFTPVGQEQESEGRAGTGLPKQNS